jgi:hypothetical protein
MKFSQEQLDDSILDRNIVMNKIKEENIMAEVNIKKELENLDRSDFNKVYDLVTKIVEDIRDVLVDIGDEEALDLTIDYMIDLINPDHLDFGEKK